MFKRLKANIIHIMNIDPDPRSIALAFSVGVFVTLTPFYGIHFWIVILLSTLFRLNHLACLTGSLVNIPPVAPLVYTVSYIIGRNITGSGIGIEEASVSLDHLISGNLSQAYRSIGIELFFSSFMTLLVGCIVFGSLVSFISYRIMLAFLRKVKGGSGE